MPTAGRPQEARGPAPALRPRYMRSIIAFPKPQSGVDPMTQAPTPVDDLQLRDLGLRLLP